MFLGLIKYSFFFVYINIIEFIKINFERLSIKVYFRILNNFVRIVCLFILIYLVWFILYFSDELVYIRFFLIYKLYFINCFILGFIF